ncbi:uncharacterized protein LOC112847669, partial [Tachysurus ichikawai]
MAMDVERKLKSCGHCVRRKTPPEKAAPLLPYQPKIRRPQLLQNAFGNSIWYIMGFQSVCSVIREGILSHESSRSFVL